MATTLSPVSAGAKGAAAETDGPEGKKKGGKKKLIIIVLVVLLVAGGGFYETKGKKKATGPVKPVKGAVLALDSVNLNLADGHYLKLDIALQETKKAPSTLDGSQALDIAISQFSGDTVAELSVPAKREAAKQAYLAKLETAYPGSIMDVYFTEFVMQ